MTTPAPGDGPDRTVRTIAGLILMGIGGGVCGYAVVRTVRSGGQPSWALIAAFTIPLVIGALITFTNEIGPTLKSLIDRVPFTKGG